MKKWHKVALFLMGLWLLVVLARLQGGTRAQEGLREIHLFARACDGR